MEPEEILLMLKIILKGIDHQILKTPTGERRNVLTTANTHLEGAKEELDKIATWTDEDEDELGRIAEQEDES